MDTTPGASENQVGTVEKMRSLQKRSWKRSSTIDAFLGFFTDGLFCSFYLSLSRCASRGNVVSPIHSEMRPRDRHLESSWRWEREPG